MIARGQRLVFDFRPHGSGRRVTSCALTILVDGEPVWPVRGDEEARVEIQIDDLLAHLTDFWKPLMLRQVYPIDVHPLRPSALRSTAESRWERMPPEMAEAEDEAVTRFEEAHDLSHAFAGLYGLPSFWMLRSGDDYILQAPGTLRRLPFDDVRVSLSTVGDWICARLQAADAERWNDAVAAWHERDAGDAAGLLAWSTGLDLALATSLLDEGALEPPRNFDDPPDRLGPAAMRDRPIFRLEMISVRFDVADSFDTPRRIVQGPIKPLPLKRAIARPIELRLCKQDRCRSGRTCILDEEAQAVDDPPPIGFEVVSERILQAGLGRLGDGRCLAAPASFLQGW